MQKLKFILFTILFITSGIVALFVFSTHSFKQQIFAENALKVNDQVDVAIRFTAPSKVITADFTVVVSGVGQLVGLKCAETSTFSKIYGDATSCSLGHFDGGSTADVLAIATVKATAVGDLKIVGQGVLYDLDGNEVSGAKYTEVLYSVVDDNPDPVDPKTCFGQAFSYQKSPYEYKVNQSMSASGSNDWVKFPLNPQCRSKQVLESIFGPLDDINNDGTVFITRPNQEFQYGFTFNRIVAIQGYDTDEIKAGEPGKAGLSEQQLNDLHQAGKDTQSIENCDYNASQMVFDMVNNEAKPNMANYKPASTGYYQFDITAKFKCDANNPNQQSLGAGFVRVTGDVPLVVCKGLTGIAKDSANKTYLLTELPKDFVGKVTLTCEGKSKGKDINFLTFEFKKGTQLISQVDGTPADAIIPTECTNDEKAAGFKCVVGSATFDISGQGTYSASSKVCIVEGSVKTCSPNDHN